MNSASRITASPTLTAAFLVERVLSGEPYIGNTLYTATEWKVACQFASDDGYMVEVEDMLERDAAFVPAASYAEQDDGYFWRFFGREPFDAAPDLTAHRQATVGMGRGL